MPCASSHPPERTPPADSEGMRQKRQPRGVPVGGQYAENSHDEARSALVEANRTGALASVVQDGVDAGRAAAGYYNEARSLPLSQWEHVESNLALSAHHLSSSQNTWQPVIDDLSQAQAESALATFRQETTGYRDAARAGVVSFARSIRAGFSSVVSAVVETTREAQRENPESLRSLNAEDRAYADAQLLLGMRRSVRSVPSFLSAVVGRVTGNPGKIVGGMLSKANSRNNTLAVLERTAIRDDERGLRARRMLRLLEIADKPTDKIIEEIVERKKGSVAPSDLRAFLSERSHLELSRFRHSLDEPQTVEA